MVAGLETDMIIVCHCVVCTLLVLQINQSIDDRIPKRPENVMCGIMCEWVAIVMGKSPQTAIFAHPSGHVTPSRHLTSGLLMTTQTFVPGYIANEENVNILNYLWSKMYKL